MNPEWIADVVFISFFVYALTIVSVLILYIILRLRKTKLTIEYVAYFVGGLFSLIGGSINITLTPLQSSEIFSSIFFFAQGVAVLGLVYWKEHKDKRKQPRLKE